MGLSLTPESGRELLLDEWSHCSEPLDEHTDPIKDFDAIYTAADG